MENRNLTSAESSDFSFFQKTALVFLRIIIGYHFLYEGVSKFFMDGWTAKGFLLQSSGFLSDTFHFIANSPELLNIVNLANIYGQIFIGIGLIIGLFSRVASLGSALMLLLYYCANPPAENYLFIDRNLIELSAILILFFFNSSYYLGADYLIKKIWSRDNDK